MGMADELSIRKGGFIFPLLAFASLTWFLIRLPAPLREADQILNTTILLVVLAVYLIYDFRPTLASPPSIGKRTLAWGALGLALLLIPIGLSEGFLKSFLLFLAFAAFLRASAGCYLDRSCRPLVDAIFYAFTIFGTLLVSLPLLDWPLRLIAGRWSANIFSWFQQQVQLGIFRDQLILVINDHPYHVAAECNGFGLLGTTLILTVACLTYRRVTWIDSLLLLIAAVVLSLAGNLVRIFFIVLLAPHVGDHYMLMHETIGILAFYGFLGIQWWLISGFGKPPRRENLAQPESTDSFD